VLREYSMNGNESAAGPKKSIHDLEALREGGKVLIVSHRGVFGGGIVENTIEAFDLALKSGADILEADVARTRDGRFIMFHDETFGRLAGEPSRVSSLDFAEARAMNLRNAIGEPSGFRVNSLDDFLEHTKGHCLINLDRCWEFLDEVFAMVKRHGMADQILIKAPAHLEEGIRWLEAHDYEPNFIPIIMEDRYADALARIPPRAKVPIVEIFIDKETDLIIGEGFVRKLHEKGTRVWANALTLNDTRTLCAWHDDNASLTGDPDSGWGWLVDRGIDIIQTDWPLPLDRYLSARGRR
jgi:glycerophosphoryl diester phosphodiesterase